MKFRFKITFFFLDNFEFERDNCIIQFNHNTVSTFFERYISRYDAEVLEK